MIARRVENREGSIPWWRLTTVEWVALTLAIALVAADRKPLTSETQLAAIAAQIESETD